MYVFFGVGLYNALLNDIWKYNPTTNEWEQQPSNNPPPARAMHSAVTLGDLIYVFGGVNEANTPLGDLWEYNPTTGNWTRKADLPAGPRWSHVAAPISGKMAVWGGSNGLTYPDDVWSFDPLSNQWQEVAIVGPRRLARSLLRRRGRTSGCGCLAASQKAAWRRMRSGRRGLWPS
jgi:N-acetylneuraminic acid mutarotase